MKDIRVFVEIDGLRVEATLPVEAKAVALQLPVGNVLRAATPFIVNNVTVGEFVIRLTRL
jgi:hypothetical protein